VLAAAARQYWRKSRRRWIGKKRWPGSARQTGVHVPSLCLKGCAARDAGKATREPGLLQEAGVACFRGRKGTDQGMVGYLWK